MIFEPEQHVHFVGIGGFGLSAIARILLERGHVVSGSDRAANDLTRALARDGAAVYAGHAAEHIAGADMLIVSSAVPEDNPEVAAARAQGIPVHKRIHVLAPLMADQRVIAIAGTHGKTTTTAMTVHLLQAAGHDPSYIVGGVMGNTGTNAANGTGDIFVIEADEYDNAFLGLYPEIAVVTSIEHDHPDFFKTEAELTTAFQQFVARLPRDHGILIACGDNPGAAALAAAHRKSRKLAFTYGLDGESLTAANIDMRPDGTRFDVMLAGTLHGRAMLPMPGFHNVQNALAALYAAGPGADMALADVIPHLATFKGTGRRFEVRADVDGLAVIDDYAHHPTAIQATIAAARAAYPERELWAVWQPHTFSRTQTLWDAYLNAFEDADAVLVTDIYAAREEPIDGVNGAAIAAAIRHPAVHHAGGLDASAALLHERVKTPAVVLIMSAGTAPQIGVDLLARRGLA